MQLSNRIARIARNDVTGDPKSLADQFLNEVPEDELINMLAEMIEDAQRVQIRQEERSAFSHFFTESGAISKSRVERPSGARIAQLRKIYELPVKLGIDSKLRRNWGDLTVAEHRMRINLLEKQRTGLGTTISQHRVAIQLIEQAGVTRLRDIPAQADKAA